MDFKMSIALFFWFHSEPKLRATYTVLPTVKWWCNIGWRWFNLSNERVKYPGCEIKFGINIIHACSPVISKVNAEVFKGNMGSGRRKRETHERTDRHCGLQLIKNDFPSKAK